MSASASASTDIELALRAEEEFADPDGARLIALRFFALPDPR